MSLHHSLALTFAVTLTLFSGNSHADDRHMERALQLVEMLGIEQLYVRQKEGVEQNLQQRVQQAGLEVPADQLALVESFITELQRITEESFDWAKDRQAIAEMYADHYSERELREVIAFQEKRLAWEAELKAFEASEIGMKYVESAGKLRQEYDVITARRVAELQVRFNQALARIRTLEAESAELAANNAN